MKKQFIVFCLFVLILVSCPAKQIVLDSEIFTDFDGYEMQENDIVLLQKDSPMTICIWNTETNKLVKKYEFKKEVGESISYSGYAFLEAIDCDMIGDDVWAIAQGAQRNIIRFNIATGKLTFVARNAGGYDTMKIIQKEEDGRGTIWLSQFMQPMSGGYVRCYDTDGNLLCKFPVSANDTEFSVNTLKYDNGKYSAFCICNGCNVYYLDKNLDNQDCFRTLEFDLENKSYEFKKMPYDTFLSADFLSQFDYFQDKFQCLTNPCGNDFIKLLMCLEMPDCSDMFVNFLYYHNPLKQSYEFIKTFDDELEITRALDYISGDKENYTIIGRDISDLDNLSDEFWFIDTYKNNILTTRYSVFGLKKAMLPKGNYKTEWFVCPQPRNIPSSKAYIYDWENNRLYLTDENGNVSDVSDLVKVDLGNNQD